MVECLLFLLLPSMLIVGMFAVTTDHAADPDLARHSEGWMIWSSNAVYLAWLGFSDCHSQIDYYKVTVGSTYMANDLTKVSKLLLWVNIWENHRGSQEWTIQWHWQHWTHKIQDEDKQNKHNTERWAICTSPKTREETWMLTKVMYLTKKPGKKHECSLRLCTSPKNQGRNLNAH